MIFLATEHRRWAVISFENFACNALISVPFEREALRQDWRAARQTGTVRVSLHLRRAPRVDNLAFKVLLSSLEITLIHSLDITAKA